MGKKHKVSEKKKKEGTPSAKAPAEKQKAAKKPPVKKEEESQVFIATVAEMPVPADTTEPEDKQVQAKGLDRSTIPTDQNNDEAELTTVPEMSPSAETTEPAEMPEPTQPTELVEEPAQTVEEAVEAVEEPVQTVEEPVEAVQEPVQTVEEAVEAVEEPEAVEAEVTDQISEPVTEMEKGVLSILGVESQEDARLSIENVSKFLDHLKQQLDLPCLVTGVSAFGWEKLFIWQIGDRTGYEKLKESNPSSTDHFEMTGFDEDFDEVDGIVARVQRVSDKKEFLLPLTDLKAVEEESKNAELLKDYREWFTCPG